MTLEIQVLTWDRHTNVAGLNRLMGFLYIIYSNLIVYVYSPTAS